MMTIFKQYRLTPYIFCSFLLLCFSDAHAQTLKQLLLMPGDLSSVHQQYEQQCNQCHSDFDRSKQNTLCLDCHKTIDKDIKQQRGFHALNPKMANAECKQCHTDHKGRDADIIGMDTDTFNHQLTNFKLDGRHQQLSCNNCHDPKKEKQGFRIAEFDCQSCHDNKSPHGNQPLFNNIDLFSRCDSCHGNDNWQAIDFDHSHSDFPLLGAHQTTRCNDCHIDQQFKPLATDCNSCHAVHDIHQQRFGTDCQTCHNEKSWRKTAFNHNTDTNFSLLFSHSSLSCNSCHTEQRSVKKLSQECQGCHRADDIHNGSRGDQCASCHNEERWKKSQFNHDIDTDFVLTGKHRNTLCSGCHNEHDGNKTLGRECSSCHQLATPHGASVSNECQDCHNSDSWQSSHFSHDLVDFPLLGMHRSLSCSECHLDSNFSRLDDSSCVSCHQSDDAHAGVMGQQCEQCHSPNDWSMWLFDHDQQTDFKLHGAHQQLQCQLCHSERTEISSQCYSCHQSDDTHRGGFGRQCEQCHNDSSFSSTMQVNSP